MAEFMDSIASLAAGSTASLPLSFWICAAFALGTVLGSAAACMGGRISRGESIFGRSRCPHCGRELRAWHMVPLAGLVLLKGRCAYCAGKIPLCSAFYEAGMGLACAVLLAKAASCGLPQAALLQHVLLQYALLFFLCLAAETDRRTGFLPDSLLLPALAAALLLAAGGSRALPGSFMSAFACASLACLLFLMLRLLWLKLYGTEALGSGDAKLAFILGLATQGAVFLAVAAASLLAMLAAAHPKAREAFFVRDLAAKGAIPFGPFLAAGGIGAMIFCC